MDELTTLGSFGSVPANSAVEQVPAALRPAAPAQQPLQVDPEVLKLSVEEINEYLKSIDRQIEFNIDQATGRTIVKIMDTSTGQILRQIPSEAMLAMMQQMDKLRGLLIHAQV